jgi:DNA-binding CsgD family transcriptional regulator
VSELPVPSNIRRRRRPFFILLDSKLQIIHYEAAALALLDELCEPALPPRLPAPVETELRSALRKMNPRSDDRFTITPAPKLIVHVSRVHGGDSSFYALLVERESHRAPVESAAGRFSLTAREREVLRLAMRGLHAPDIAQTLSISPATVSGYFKELLRKTQTRNRSEMIAKVLDWDDPDAIAESG